MKQCISRKDFLQKLSLLLAFRFGEKERYSIVSDYDDYFANEMSQGKSEQEICLAIGQPREIVKKLCETEEKNLGSYIELFRNVSVQIAVTSIIFFLIELFFLNKCKKGALDNYFYFVLFSQCGYVIAGMCILRKCTFQKTGYARHMIPAGIMIGISLFEGFAGPFMHSQNSGRITVRILWLVIAVLCVLGARNIFRITGKNAAAFEMVVHLSGVVSVCMYFINEHGLLYREGSALGKSLAGGWSLYVITILCCVVLKRVAVRRK